MQLRVGTSGFSYKEWKGTFYPEDLKSADMLRWYAERLPAVEINNTFYRMPKASVLEGWCAQVPASFRFAVKASRRITHHRRLKEADEETDYLLGQLASLGERLGVVLFQLPPNLPADRDRLARFLDHLAGRVPAAFEFRHASWRDDDVASLLRERGAALVVSETDDGPDETLVATARHAYLRLRRSAYAEADLARWAAALRAADLDCAYVFFKHEDAGAGPRLAEALRERLGPGGG